MTAVDIAQRLFQIAVGGFCVFMAIGGGISHRVVETDGIRTTVFTIYKRLPPAPAGPSYCSIFDHGDRGLVLPCDFKPPFVGWLQGGKY
jgi:hypothetical protein